MGAASMATNIPYSAPARAIKGAVSKVTKPVTSKVSQFAGSAVNRLKQEFLPAEIGVHHSVTTPMGELFSGNVRPSGQWGFTAQDQIPGYSYFWSTTGKGGARSAVKEAEWQTRHISDVRLLDDGQNAAIYVTKSPRGLSIEDANVPGSRARAVPGGQEVIKGFQGTGDMYNGVMRQLSPKDMREVAAAVNRAKLAEAARSASKIAGTAGAIGLAAQRAQRTNKR